MGDLSSRISALWETVKGSPAVTRARVAIPSSRVDVGAKLGTPFARGDHYFSVRVNELYLSKAREWISTIDPMVTTVTEFIYDGQETRVPFVVGPSLIEQFGVQRPAGMTLANTRVAGLHPFRGGRISLTVILYKVTVTDHARDLMRIIQTGAAALDFGSALGGYLKVADAIITGVESVMHLGGTQPIMGHRVEYDADSPDEVMPGYHVLIDLPEKEVKPERLFVKDGRLHEGDGFDSSRPFERADFVLYSLVQDAKRSDLDLLPFNAQVKRVTREAQTPVREAWENAKVSLASLIQTARESPDLARAQCDALLTEWKAEAVRLHQDAVDLSTLDRTDRSLEQRAAAATRDEALSVLAL